MIRYWFIVVAVVWLVAGSTVWADLPRGPTCVYPDLTGMTPVTLIAGAAPAAGTGGDVPGGRWELVAVRYANSPLPITGDAVGALELDAATATTGSGSLALDVTITAPVAEQIDETGAGPYSATGTVLDFQNDCGAESLLGEAEYSVETAGPDPVMTLWGETVLDTGLGPITILIEAEFVLVEPQTSVDSVFDDRFETL